jgi:hypothetical protein
MVALAHATGSVAIPVSIQQDDQEFNGKSDTLRITPRAFSSSTLAELTNDEDFNYKQPPTVAESLWDRFLRWIGWLIAMLFSAATTTDLGRLLLYTIAVIVIIVVIMSLLKVNAFRVFYGDADRGHRPYPVFNENIHEMDFGALLHDAVSKNDFRLATRLLFLHALKLLSDKHLIAFHPGKTNHDYVEELGSSQLKKGFNELSLYFDYAWYGHFDISERQFQKIQSLFSDWQHKLNT